MLFFIHIHISAERTVEQKKDEDECKRTSEHTAIDLHESSRLASNQRNEMNMSPSDRLSVSPIFSLCYLGCVSCFEIYRSFLLENGSIGARDVEIKQNDQTRPTHFFIYYEVIVLEQV
jgi:hypothetical protein